MKDNLGTILTGSPYWSEFAKITKIDRLKKTG